jgi:hypothetical protein
MDKIAPKKPVSRVALALLPLAAWWTALAVWLSVGGGIGVIRDTPFSGMAIMTIGTIVAVVLSMVLGRWAGNTARRP